jgi:hypothetical protein
LIDEDQNEGELIQQLIDEGMPERKKQKKTKDVEVEMLGGGASIYIPQKRKRTTKYPNGVDPENPGTPDPERWLPKWQRKGYKKLAKKKGLYLKGAQGDAQISTDITHKADAPVQQVKEAKSGKNKRRRK